MLPAVIPAKAGIQGGFTLIELIIVVSIIGVLIVALGFQYQGWRARYNVESQVRQVQADLMTARMRAMERDRIFRLTFGPNSYSVFWATNDAGTVFLPAPGWPTSMPLDFAPSWTSTVDFNTRGLVSAPASVATTVLPIWFTDRGAGSDVDCIEISRTRIGIGKWGTICNVK